MTLTVDLFAGGARGWDIHDGELGLTSVGYESDPFACATSRAAGFVTVEGDVRLQSPPPGAVGMKGGPPCQTFSASGNGSGRRDLDKVLNAMADLWVTGWIDYAHFGDARTGLVLEPLRWAIEGDFEWITLEQVPPVLPVWQAYRIYLEKLGYHTWAGLVHAEQYGVPQTRKRAVLIASRTKEVGRPEPTHSKYHVRNPAKLDEGVLPWVSMANAIHRGLWNRPSPTITGGGTATGGAEPIAKLARYIGTDWVQRSNYSTGGSGRTAEERGRSIRTMDQPSVTMTSKSAQWTDHPELPTKSYRITVQEAAVLQSLPADHPWQGNLGRQYLQVGNAIPALMARAILREVL
jgi:DNA (cytosine-5)-methyltransferase 1